MKRLASRLLVLVLPLLAACKGSPSSGAAKVEAAKVAPQEAVVAAEATTGPSAALDAYLAAIPREPPTLATAITGTPGGDPSTDIPRCQKTGWSYYQCDKVFPQQGLQWVRWECMHGETPHSRSILCARLAEYLYGGVGGPREPALANALFDRQCREGEAAYYANCYMAATTLTFDEPARALDFAKRGCSSPSKSSIGCPALLRTLEAGPKSRKVVVEQVEGLAAVVVGGECKVWLWPSEPGSCGARLACGDAVLYGAGGSTVPCKDDGTGGEDMTTEEDGDPSFRLGATQVELRDDKAGRLGAFTLRGRVE